MFHLPLAIVAAVAICSSNNPSGKIRISNNRYKRHVHRSTLKEHVQVAVAAENVREDAIVVILLAARVMGAEYTLPGVQLVSVVLRAMAPEEPFAQYVVVLVIVVPVLAEEQ